MPSSQCSHENCATLLDYKETDAVWGGGRTGEARSLIGRNWMLIARRLKKSRGIEIDQVYLAFLSPKKLYKL